MQFSNLDNNIIKSQAIVSKQNKFANFFTIIITSSTAKQPKMAKEEW